MEGLRSTRILPSSSSEDADADHHGLRHHRHSPHHQATHVNNGHDRAMGASDTDIDAGSALNFFEDGQDAGAGTMMALRHRRHTVEGTLIPHATTMADVDGSAAHNSMPKSFLLSASPYAALEDDGGDDDDDADECYEEEAEENFIPEGGGNLEEGENHSIGEEVDDADFPIAADHTNTDDDSTDVSSSSSSSSDGGERGDDHTRGLMAIAKKVATLARSSGKEPPAEGNPRKGGSTTAAAAEDLSAALQKAIAAKMIGRGIHNKGGPTTDMAAGSAATDLPQRDLDSRGGVRLGSRAGSGNINNPSRGGGRIDHRRGSDTDKDFAQLMAVRVGGGTNGADSAFSSSQAAIANGGSAVMSPMVAFANANPAVATRVEEVKRLKLRSDGIVSQLLIAPHGLAGGGGGGSLIGASSLLEPYDPTSAASTEFYYNAQLAQKIRAAAVAAMAIGGGKTDHQPLRKSGGNSFRKQSAHQSLSYEKEPPHNLLERIDSVASFASTFGGGGDGSGRGTDEGFNNDHCDDDHGDDDDERELLAENNSSSEHHTMKKQRSFSRGSHTTVAGNRNTRRATTNSASSPKSTSTAATAQRPRRRRSTIADFMLFSSSINAISGVAGEGDGSPEESADGGLVPLSNPPQRDVRRQSSSSPLNFHIVENVSLGRQNRGGAGAVSLLLSSPSEQPLPSYDQMLFDPSVLQQSRLGGGVGRGDIGGAPPHQRFQHHNSSVQHHGTMPLNTRNLAAHYRQQAISASLMSGLLVTNAKRRKLVEQLAAADSVAVKVNRPPTPLASFVMPDIVLDGDGKWTLCGGGAVPQQQQQQPVEATVKDLMPTVYSAAPSSALKADRITRNASSDDGGGGNAAPSIAFDISIEAPPAEEGADLATTNPSPPQISAAATNGAEIPSKDLGTATASASSASSKPLLRDGAATNQHQQLLHPTKSHPAKPLKSPSTLSTIKAAKTAAAASIRSGGLSDAIAGAAIDQQLAEKCEKIAKNLNFPFDVKEHTESVTEPAPLPTEAEINLESYRTIELESLAAHSYSILAMVKMVTERIAEAQERYEKLVEIDKYEAQWLVPKLIDRLVAGALTGEMSHHRAHHRDMHRAQQHDDDGGTAAKPQQNERNVTGDDDGEGEEDEEVHHHQIDDDLLDALNDDDDGSMMLNEGSVLLSASHRRRRVVAKRPPVTQPQDGRQKGPNEVPPHHRLPPGPPVALLKAGYEVPQSLLTAASNLKYTEHRLSLTQDRLALKKKLLRHVQGQLRGVRRQILAQRVIINAVVHGGDVEVVIPEEVTAAAIAGATSDGSTITSSSAAGGIAANSAAAAALAAEDAAEDRLLSYCLLEGWSHVTSRARQMEEEHHNGGGGAAPHAVAAGFGASAATATAGLVLGAGQTALLLANASSPYNQFKKSLAKGATQMLPSGQMMKRVAIQTIGDGSGDAPQSSNPSNATNHPTASPQKGKGKGQQQGAKGNAASSPMPSLAEADENNGGLISLVPPPEKGKKTSTLSSTNVSAKNKKKSVGANASSVFGNLAPSATMSTMDIMGGGGGADLPQSDDDDDDGGGQLEDDARQPRDYGDDANQKTASGTAARKRIILISPEQHNTTIQIASPKYGNTASNGDREVGAATSRRLPTVKKGIEAFLHKGRSGAYTPPPSFTANAYYAVRNDLNDDGEEDGGGGPNDPRRKLPFSASTPSPSRSGKGGGALGAAMSGGGGVNNSYHNVNDDAEKRRAEVLKKRHPNSTNTALTSTALRLPPISRPVQRLNPTLGTMRSGIELPPRYDSMPLDKLPSIVQKLVAIKGDANSETPRQRNKRETQLAMARKKNGDDDEEEEDLGPTSPNAAQSKDDTKTAKVNRKKSDAAKGNNNGDNYFSDADADDAEQLRIEEMKKATALLEETDAIKHFVLRLRAQDDERVIAALAMSEVRARVKTVVAKAYRQKHNLDSPLQRSTRSGVPDDEDDADEDEFDRIRKSTALGSRSAAMASSSGGGGVGFSGGSAGAVGLLGTTNRNGASPRALNGRAVSFIQSRSETDDGATSGGNGGSSAVRPLLALGAFLEGGHNGSSVNSGEEEFNDTVNHLDDGSGGDVINPSSSLTYATDDTNTKGPAVRPRPRAKSTAAVSSSVDNSSFLGVSILSNGSIVGAGGRAGVYSSSYPNRNPDGSSLSSPHPSGAGGGGAASAQNYLFSKAGRHALSKQLYLEAVRALTAAARKKAQDTALEEELLDDYLTIREVMRAREEEMLQLQSAAATPTAGRGDVAVPSPNPRKSVAAEAHQALKAQAAAATAALQNAAQQKRKNGGGTLQLAAANDLGLTKEQELSLHASGFSGLGEIGRRHVLHHIATKLKISPAAIAAATTASPTTPTAVSGGDSPTSPRKAKKADFSSTLVHEITVALERKRRTANQNHFLQAKPIGVIASEKEEAKKKRKYDRLKQRRALMVSDAQRRVLIPSSSSSSGSDSNDDDGDGTAGGEGARLYLSPEEDADRRKKRAEKRAARSKSDRTGPGGDRDDGYYGKATVDPAEAMAVNKRVLQTVGGTLAKIHARIEQENDNHLTDNFNHHSTNHGTGAQKKATASIGATPASQNKKTASGAEPTKKKGTGAAAAAAVVKGDGTDSPSSLVATVTYTRPKAMTRALRDAPNFYDRQDVLLKEIGLNTDKLERKLDRQQRRYEKMLREDDRYKRQLAFDRQVKRRRARRAEERERRKEALLMMTTCTHHGMATGAVAATTTMGTPSSSLLPVSGSDAIHSNPPPHHSPSQPPPVLDAASSKRLSDAAALKSKLLFFGDLVSDEDLVEADGETAEGDDNGDAASSVGSLTLSSVSLNSSVVSMTTSDESDRDF